MSPYYGGIAARVVLGIFFFSFLLLYSVVVIKLALDPHSFGRKGWHQDNCEKLLSPVMKVGAVFARAVLVVPGEKFEKCPKAA